MKQRFGLTIAAKEHLLEGKPLTRLEAMIFFGIPDLTKIISVLRKQGWRIESRRTSLAAAVVRVNEFATLEMPPNLPQRDIVVTEYWLAK
mgnify:CR=1 FL=1